MTGHRAIFGLCALWALVFSAIAAQGAAAGQTAFTCVSTAPKLEFKAEHCVPGETGTSFGHVAITEETHAKISNEKTNATTTGISNSVFKTTIVGTNLEIESTGAVEGLGTIKNEEVGGEMRATATTDASGITYKGVIVKAPANKGCKVFEDKGGVKGAEGIIKTKPLKMHTTATGTSDEVIIEPAEAGSSIIATFFLECEPGKVPPELEGKWEIRGSDKCLTHGATIECVHSAITTQNTLHVGGLKAGLEGKLTITAGKFPVTEPTHPVSVTTTTP